MKAEPSRTTISRSLGVQVGSILGGSVARRTSATIDSIGRNPGEPMVFYEFQCGTGSGRLANGRKSLSVVGGRTSVHREPTQNQRLSIVERTNNHWYGRESRSLTSRAVS